MILFIHGMFMTPKCWDHWIEFFKERGLAGRATAWPEHNKSVPDLNRNFAANTALAGLRFTDLIAAFENQISKLPEKPVLVGHSVGGLIVQILINKGLGRAGVAIDSAPPKGLRSFRPSFLRSNSQVVNPFVSAKIPYVMKLGKFRYAFANSMTRQEQEEAYRTYIVPESIRVPRDLGKKAVIDFKKAHAPLLLIAGSADHIIPAGLNRRNFGRYAQDNGSRTEFKEFEGRSHTIILQKGWDEVAGFACDWIRRTSH
jgi:alpha-beta hydrolase superfamily lysophospholipase